MIADLYLMARLLFKKGFKVTSLSETKTLAGSTDGINVHCQGGRQLIPCTPTRIASVTVRKGKGKK
jgi:hypothetical protein